MTDASFRSRQSTGRQSECDVGFDFARLGFGVEIPAMRTRPDGCTAAVRASYADHYDLIVAGKDPGQHWVIEVKSRTLNFSGTPSEYPYPTAFVCAKARYDKAEAGRVPMPYAWVLCSQNTGERLVALEKDRAHWTVTETWDRARRCKGKFLCCPREYLVTWSEMVERMNDGD